MAEKEMKCALRQYYNSPLKQFYDKHIKNFKNDNIIFRVRDEKNFTNIIYYNGNKVFDVKEDKKEYYLSITPSFETFKTNTTTISNLLIEGKNVDNEKERLKLLRESISEFYKFELDKISFKLADKCDPQIIEDKISAFYDKYKIFDKNKVIEKIKKEYEKEAKERNTVEIVFNEKINDCKKIIDIQFDFIKLVRLDDGKTVQWTVKGVKLNDSIELKEKYDSNEVDKVINNILESVKTAIDKYNGKDELEKKYQHRFMLYAKESNLFNREEHIYPFEQEYPIYNDERKKDGRVDCVFYKLNAEETKIEDIYLIELKVNESVILGNNGVLTHLDDIRVILNKKNRNKTLNDLASAINNRLKITNENNNGNEHSKRNDFKMIKIDKQNIKIHFYTIIGYSDDDGLIKAKEQINYLKDKNNVYLLSYDLKRMEKKEQDRINQKKGDMKGLYLDNYFHHENKDINLEKMINDKCDIKFYFEKTKWDKTMTKGNMNFEQMKVL